MFKYYKVFILLIFLGLSNSLLAQQRAVEDFIKKIDVKLKDDVKYLNLHFYTYRPSENPDPEFRSIPRPEGREPYSFVDDEYYSYDIVFLKDGVGLDSIYVLYVKQIKQPAPTEGGLFDQAAATNDTTIVLKFNDLWYLKNEQRSYYDKFLEIIQQKLIESEDNYQEVPTLLGLNVDNQIKTSLGMTSRDNSDYLRFERIMSHHWFMKEPEKRSGRGRGGSAGADSPFRFDVSLTKIGFSHEMMSFGNGVAGVEISFEEPVLNLLPYQSGAMAAGSRILFAMANDPDINKSTYLDARFQIRLPLGKLYDAMPFVILDSTTLNTSTSVVGDISVTRPFDLPFMRLYFAFGDPVYTSPEYIVNKGASRYAYYSFSQAEFTYSFFWNTSEIKEGRFKLDVGGGYYDIHKATLNASGGIGKKEVIQDKFFPVIGLQYAFVPRNNPLFGGSTKFFDGQVKLNTWFKIAELGDNQVLRFEAMYVSDPITRKKREWETSGGILVQFRYRYGM
ncbi:MAG: hypothetical protein K9J12_05805 [Melioribacteraceae bacterium]|nr:hypothetical protein [Melioribacteraceae bacterium]MCF8431974.1 hypothetical protein [Melioribacteraceae bacterium]